MTAHSSRFYHALQVAAHRLQKQADLAVSGAAGISSAQSAVLAVIARSPGMRQNEVARTLGLNESAVTAMITRLIGLDLVQRSRSAEDSRAWELSLTDEGTAALSAIETPFAKINTLIDETLGEDVDEFATLLRALSDRLARS
ncbi:MarR family winged helix-turn-helix transcriptional regulator [uncultured Hyphomonas sp.]|jgi:DNA-binding MarR family transcriptional regulator|uniref:MarR family winged helix-turn-helix transcriptional regulator n=1 Tax=uncultured Hyphomonas sp. TaxID=225298 RepID=UPI0030D71AC0|tara:strand:+ start:4324 stop:4752 length:429 start_codon:yes stop_codon:yes gene_type:complete